MYKVFDMGHHLEVYLSPEHAEEVVAINKSFSIDTQIVGCTEESDKEELIIKSELGEFRCQLRVNTENDSACVKAPKGVI